MVPGPSGGRTASTSGGMGGLSWTLLPTRLLPTLLATTVDLSPDLPQLLLHVLLLQVRTDRPPSSTGAFLHTLGLFQPSGSRWSWILLLQPVRRTQLHLLPLGWNTPSVWRKDRRRRRCYWAAGWYAPAGGARGGVAAAGLN